MRGYREGKLDDLVEVGSSVEPFDAEVIFVPMFKVSFDHAPGDSQKKHEALLSKHKLDAL